MSYVDNNLLPQEKVVLRTRLHWIIFLFPLIWLVLYLLLNRAAAFIDILMLYPIAKIIPLVLLVGDSIRTFIRYETTAFILTNKRLIIKVGFIFTVTSEFFLQKIETMQTQQSILGKLFGYGTLVVHGTGGTQASFFLIDQPAFFCRQVQEQVEYIADKTNSDR